MARKAKPVVEEVDELDELEELEEEAPPKKSAKKAKAAEPAKKTRRVASDDDDETPDYGVKWLCGYISEEIGKEYTAASLRVLLRKMARAGELPRVVGEDRGRYEFSGPNDAVVKAILKQVKEGAVEKGKAERLADVKAKNAVKKGKKAAEPEPDDDEDDDEEEEEKPVPKKPKATRRR